MLRRWLALLLVLTPCAHAAPPPTQWYTVLLDGRKIGSFEARREAREATVVTTQTLDLVLDRAGSQLALFSRESATETADGRPLAFASVTKLSGSDTVVEGRVREGRIEATTRSGGATRQRSLPWPEGALLPEGLRLAGLRAGLAPGTRYRALAFQPASLEAAEISSAVGAPEDLDLPGGRLRLSPLDQSTALGGASMASRAWVDAEQTVHKLTMPLMGVELTLLACDRACATAPNQPSDVFERTLARAPRPLARAELDGTLRYALAVRGDALSLPQTDEQRVERDGDTWIVTVSRRAQGHGEAKPQADDYRPNDWLQSSAPEIVQLAQRAVGEAQAPRARMQRIEAFVRTYIRDKTLDVGYASALEVARRPEGDCTEHAVLVAALGRALGIATRLVNGLAYAPGFAGRDQVFVPHAWAQAFVDGRWQSFDAALPGFDAGHIALSIGDGDPWRFYSGLDLLGRIELERAEAVAEPAR